MQKLLENDLERLARTLVDRFGVEVVCKGDNACTDGQRIVLPSMPDPLNEGLERMMVGHLDHESRTWRSRISRWPPSLDERAGQAPFCRDVTLLWAPSIVQTGLHTGGRSPQTKRSQTRVCSTWSRTA